MIRVNSPGLVKVKKSAIMETKDRKETAMKKTGTVILLLAGILLSLCGCGVSEIRVVQTTATPSPTAAPTPTPEVTALPLYDCTPYVGEKTAEGFRLPRFDLSVKTDDTWITAGWKNLWDDMEEYTFTEEAEFLSWLQERGEMSIFRAVREDGFARLLITLETESEVDMSSSEEEFIAKNKEDMAETIRQNGFSYVDSEVISYDIGENTHVGMRVHGKLESVDVYITMVAVRSGELFTIVTASSYVKDETEELLRMVETCV